MNLDRLRDRFFEGVSRYRWIETIGRGGMGIVFRAHDLDLEEEVAIKVLSPDWETDDQQLLTRFKREINLNRKIKHPNVARIHDFGMSGDYPFITMEFVPGVDLRTLIQSQGRIAPAQSIAILRQIALGTEAAHRLGIIHRDLKSQNVMVEDSGAVAILDFGLARGKQSVTLTLDSVMVGTPHYMSPEQALGRPTDARSDVYSIGVMAFEMLTGKVPFDGESPLVIAMKHVSELMPDDLSRFSDISPELHAIVLKALAKNADGRFTSAADLEAELAMLRPFVPEARPAGVEAALTPEAPGFPAAPPAAPVSEPGWPPIQPDFSLMPSAPGTPIPSTAGMPIPSAGVPFEVSAAAIPAAKMPSAAMPKVPPAPPKKTRLPVVLLVADDVRGRTELADALGEYAAKTIGAGSGEKALEILLKEEVDLVLMDTNLPGMDGFDVTRVLRSQHATANLPVVLMSQRIDRGRFAFAIQSGATDYLLRHAKVETMAGRIWNILEHHGFVPPADNAALHSAIRKTLLDAVTLTPPSVPLKK
jgi:serine/threonine protein kinase/DNA-binding NarL/FixJ family response regulator